MKKILICEDDLISRMILSMYLSDNYELTKVEDGKKAIEIIKNNDFDLMLIDIQMPYYSGLDLLKFIRNDQKKNTPIIMLTGYSNKEILQHTKELGADDYLIKPYDSDSLLNKINFLISKD